MRINAVIMACAGLMVSVNASAECLLPSFIKEGNTYMAMTGMVTPIVKVLEIDKQTCWIKVSSDGQGEFWINVTQLLGIKSK